MNPIKCIPPGRRSATRRHGTAAVEASLVMLLLLTITFGVIEYSWMFLKQQHITNTVRQAARLGATADATTAQVNSTISSMMAAYGLSGSGYTTTITPGEVSGLAKGVNVTVSISVAYDNVDITGMKLFPTPETIRAAVTMEKEGP